MTPMRVGLTGTPGTGKTRVAEQLKQYDYRVISLNDLAVDQRFVCGKDSQRDTKLVDIEALNSYIHKQYTSDELVFFEGHIAHLLTCMDKIILLRCRPTLLLKRLKQKQWAAHKIKENVDAEALDVILCETAERFHEEDVFELDTTSKKPNEISAIIHEIIKQNFSPISTYTIGRIDWSEEYFQDHV